MAAGVRSTAVTHVILPPQGTACSARPLALLNHGAMPLLQAPQPCSAPLPQEELADSCPSEFPVSTPPQAARLQKARRTNSGAALAYFLRSLESNYCSSSLAASVLGNRKANELSRLLLLCPFLLLYLAMYIASYLPGGSGPHVLSRPDALGGESTFTFGPQKI